MIFQTVNRITALKNMGFSLSSIAEIMRKYSDTEELLGFLSVKLVEVRDQEQETQNRLMLIESAIKRLGKDDYTMNYDVTLKEMPQRTVASLRKVIPAYDKERILFYSSSL